MNRKLLILIASVASVHLLIFFFDFKGVSKVPAPKKSIVVRTFVPPPPPKQRAAAKPIAKIEKPKSKRLTKKNEILKELKESLTKIEKVTPIEKKNVLTFPKNIQNLQIDQTEKVEETHYFVLLAHALKEELELPEYGEVKLELTVLHTGRVLKLRVLHAASEKNRRYLELNIPNLSLPQFNEDLKNESEYTFTLTFCNEI